MTSAASAHPSTEARAGHSASGQIKTNALAVHRALANHPNSTAAELWRCLDMDVVEVRRRLDDLRKAGIAEQSGKRKCEVAKTLAFEWRLTPKQMDLF